ncbi:MAG: hypothetical protein Kow0069_25580 [Promethearchaeota archaeon]
MGASVSALGLLSRLFSREELEVVEQLDRKLEAMRKRAKSPFAALVGTSGTAKGLAVWLGMDEGEKEREGQYRRQAARLAEVFIRLLSLGLEPPVPGLLLAHLRVAYTDGKSPLAAHPCYHVVPLPGDDRFVFVAVAPVVGAGLNKFMKEVGQLAELTRQLAPGLKTR